MIKISDVPEMVEALRRGELRLLDVEGLLVDLLVENEVQDVTAPLPVDVRERFEALLREIFAEEVDVEDITLFDSARGMHPQKEQIVAAARRWLRAGTTSAVPVNEDV